MKNLFQRSMLALACAATLAACGGGNGNLVLGGSVVGLTRAGLVLKNGSATVAVASGAATFAFAGLIPSNANYDVQIQTQPSGADCTVANGTAKSGTINVTTVVVTCQTHQFALGGSVTGLTADGLILNNGNATVAIPAGSTTFTFATKVNLGSLYGVTVLQQPTGQQCVLLNNSGNGEMGAQDVSSVQLSCAAI